MNVVAALPGLRAGCMVRRNSLVLRRMLGTNVACLVVDAAIVLIGYGYGFGALVGDVGGMSYPVFLASGIVALTAGTAAVFESLDAVHSRAMVQRTWMAMLLAPLRLSDLVIGELLWAAIKATGASLVVLILAAALGFLPWGSLPLIIPAAFLCSLSYCALVLCFEALCISYDQHEYYYNIIHFPMVMLCGMFFPRENLPDYLQIASEWLPLTQMVELVRPLALGQSPESLGALLGYQVIVLVGATALAYRLHRNRMLRHS